MKIGPANILNPYAYKLGKPGAPYNDYVSIDVGRLENVNYTIHQIDAV